MISFLSSAFANLNLGCVAYLVVAAADETVYDLLPTLLPVEFPIKHVLYVKT